MEDIKLIVIKAAQKLLPKNTNRLDLDLRIFCTQENCPIKNIKLIWGYQTDESISPLPITNANEKNLIKKWKEINFKDFGILKKTVSMPQTATHFILNYLSDKNEKTLTQRINEKTDLLPNNATDFERVLALTTTRLSDLSEAIISPFDIEKTPKQTLPWLAWLFSVDNWSPFLDTKTQRNLIINSIKLHRKKGTKASIKNALEQIGGPVEIKEWWEENKNPRTKQDRYRFKIYLNINNADAPFTKAYYSNIKKSVDKLKPATTSYSLALKANVRLDMDIILLGYAMTRINLYMELST